MDSSTHILRWSLLCLMGRAEFKQKERLNCDAGSVSLSQLGGEFWRKYCTSDYGLWVLHWVFNIGLAVKHLLYLVIRYEHGLTVGGSLHLRQTLQELTDEDCLLTVLPTAGQQLLPWRRICFKWMDVNFHTLLFSNICNVWIFPSNFCFIHIPQILQCSVFFGYYSVKTH